MSVSSFSEISGRALVQAARDPNLIGKIDQILSETNKFRAQVAEIEASIPIKKLYFFEGVFSITKDIRPSLPLVVLDQDFFSPEFASAQTMICWKDALAKYLNQKFSELADLFPQEERQKVRDFFIQKNKITHTSHNSDEDDHLPIKIKKIFTKIATGTMKSDLEKSQNKYEKTHILPLRQKRQEFIEKLTSEDLPFQDSKYFKNLCSDCTIEKLETYKNALRPDPNMLSEAVWLKIIRVWKEEIQKPRSLMKIDFTLEELNPIKSFDLYLPLSFLLDVIQWPSKEQLKEKIKQIEDQIDEKSKQAPLYVGKPLTSSLPQDSIPLLIELPLESTAPQTIKPAETQSLIKDASSLSENKKESKNLLDFFYRIFRTPFALIAALWMKIQQFFS